VDGVDKKTKSLKKTSIEITSVFEAWADAGGRFADVINPKFDELKANANEITSVFEELRAKQLDETVVNPKFDEGLAKATDSAREFGLIMTSALSKSITEFKSLGDVAMSIGEDILQMILRITVMKPLENALTSAFSAGSTGGFFDSIMNSIFGAANGGIIPGSFKPIQAFAGGSPWIGRPTLGLVGEGAHPEAIVPLPDGRSIPVTMRGGNGGGNIKVEIINNGAPQQVQSATPSFDADGMVVRIITADLRTNGPVSQHMAGTFGLRRGA